MFSMPFPPEENRSEVKAADLRFSQPGERAFTARQWWGRSGKASAARFQLRGANSPVIRINLRDCFAVACTRRRQTGCIRHKTQSA